MKLSKVATHLIKVVLSTRQTFNFLHLTPSDSYLLFTLDIESGGQTTSIFWTSVTPINHAFNICITRLVATQLSTYCVCMVMELSVR